MTYRGWRIMRMVGGYPPTYRADVQGYDSIWAIGDTDDAAIENLKGKIDKRMPKGTYMTKRAAPRAIVQEAICANCQGKGKIFRKLPDYLFRRWVTCYSCEGSGKEPKP